MLLEAVKPLRLEPATRASAGRILSGIQAPDMLYAVLIAGTQVVTMVQPKNKEHALHTKGTLSNLSNLLSLIALATYLFCSQTSFS